MVRITDPDLVRLIFRTRPETVAIHSRTPTADYRVVRVTYRDQLQRPNPPSAKQQPLTTP